MPNDNDVVSSEDADSRADLSTSQTRGRGVRVMEYEGRPIAEIETRRLDAERFRKLKDHFRVSKREDWGDLWAATVLWVSQYRLPPDSPQWKSFAGYMSEKDALADLARLGKVPRLEWRIVRVTVEEVATNAERASK